MKVDLSFKDVIENIIYSSPRLKIYLEDNSLKRQLIQKAELEYSSRIPFISIVIMTFNEERCIYRCLNSIKNLADEIIIIDTGSTDNTLNIIKDNFPSVKVYNEKWNKDFSEIRNKLIGYASYEWVFQLDADEYISDEILHEIKKMIFLVESIPVDPIVISPIIINHDESELFQTKRIFKKNKGLKYFGLAHEELRFNNNPSVEYIVIKYKIFHDGYNKEIISLKDKDNRNFYLINETLKLEPNNLRWYYFFGREGISLKISKEIIESKLEYALSNDFYDPHDYESGIYTLLMELNLDNEQKLYTYTQKAIEKNNNLMEIYFYKFLGEELNRKMLTTEGILNNVNELRGLTNPYSLINSNGDHLFHAWGWSYFEIKDYELALEMWRKINSLELKKNIMDELLNTSEKIHIILKEMNQEC
ncbi:glycosyltransferase [Exiguobacterium mexicanum]